MNIFLSESMIFIIHSDNVPLAGKKTINSLSLKCIINVNLVYSFSYRLSK